MILKCSCQHGAQDSFHGAGNRVHTPVRPKRLTDPPTHWRCTVCLTEREVAYEPKKEAV